jgi:hypothetical protein
LQSRRWRLVASNAMSIIPTRPQFVDHFLSTPHAQLEEPLYGKTISLAAPSAPLSRGHTPLLVALSIVHTERSHPDPRRRGDRFIKTGHLTVNAMIGL